MERVLIYTYSIWIFFLFTNLLSTSLSLRLLRLVEILRTPRQFCLDPHHSNNLFPKSLLLKCLCIEIRWDSPQSIPSPFQSLFIFHKLLFSGQSFNCLHVLRSVWVSNVPRRTYFRFGTFTVWTFCRYFTRTYLSIIHAIKSLPYPTAQGEFLLVFSMRIKAFDAKFNREMFEFLSHLARSAKQLQISVFTHYSET